MRWPADTITKRQYRRMYAWLRVALSAIFLLAGGSGVAAAERENLRVLVTYDSTRFFAVHGEFKGFEYELLKQYQAWREEMAEGRLDIDFYFIPVALSEIVPGLVAGRGDLGAAGLTVTGERARDVLFTDPYLPDVHEVVVAAAGEDSLDRLEDLAGRTVYVMKGSSYVEHLYALNERFDTEGLTAIDIVEVDAELSSGDILELVNAGIVDLTVVDDHVARIWAGVLPDIVVRDDLVVHAGGEIAWAVSPHRGDLLEGLNAFIDAHRKGSLIGNVLFSRYFDTDNWITNPLASEGVASFTRYRELFERYAAEYGFDWHFIVAQAYQESRLDNDRRSPAGAVGLMQVTKLAAKQVGMSNFVEPEDNIHAGVRYLAYLRDSYFDDADLDPVARVHFALAAYNAGPSRIKALRERARDEGVDPNHWFKAVETLAARDIGQEPVRYVARIVKYYVAYSRIDEIVRARSSIGDDPKAVVER